MLSVESFFGPGSELAQAHPTYEDRPGQAEMARAVARTLDRGGQLLVEAGTGTGKTLAYLVPAIASGRRVVISTGTRNLQDQIYQKDLPFLRDRVGIDVRATVMKGRDNYLCRYRLHEFERAPMLEDLGETRWISRIAAWGRETGTGDRAEIPDLPDELKLWRDINARADTCGGSRCPEYEDCWLTRMKRRAADSQIVLVNHHLFFADLAVRSAYGQVLPDYDTVVFDEAHLLEEVATMYFGTQVSSNQLEELARQAERLAARTGGPARGGGGAAMLREAMRDFFLPLRDRLDDAQGRVRFEREDHGGPDVEAEWAMLSEALAELLSQAEGVAGDEGADAFPQRVREVGRALEHVLDRSDPAFVYGMEQRGRGAVVLTAAPIDVSGLLRENLFEQLHASVLTSATLAVDGSFEFFGSRLGTDEAETLVVDSPFDFEEQARLYLPREMPEPRDREFPERAAREIVELLRITDGRAFLLFTSYANMHRVHRALRRLPHWKLFRQGEGSKVALVDEFRRTPRAVLLGTSSFWHGVDVPGDALSLVVVDKLPFDVPSDPLVAARIERIREQQGNPFKQYQIPLAVLELKQGLGRLIRSRSDRGLLAVLDPRLTRKSYGRTFLRSLPPYPIVRDREEAARFFHGGETAAPEGAES